MNNFLSALKESLTNVIPVSGIYAIPNFHYKFDVHNEGLLPQWSEEAQIEGPEQALAELEFLISGADNVLGLRQKGFYHRDDIACTETIKGLRDYEYYERVHATIEMFAEKDVIIEDEEALKEVFVDNGMMAKHLTLDGCMTAVGFPEQKEVELAYDGYLGLQHGEAFGYADNYGTFNFHQPQVLPDLTKEYGERLLEGTMTYMPKQISMHFTKLPLSIVGRMRIAKHHISYDEMVQLDKLIYAIELGDDNQSIIDLGLPIELDDFDIMTRTEMKTMAMDILGIPTMEVHTRLALTDLNVLEEYSYEVLPYMIYSEFICKKLGFHHATFTINVDCVLMDKEATWLLNELLDYDDLHNAQVPVMSIIRDTNIPLDQQPLTMEDLSITGYIGAE